MSDLEQRFAASIERYGESFSVDGSSRKGVFMVLSASRAMSYLEESLVLAMPRPIRSAFVLASDPTTVDDTVSLDGQDLTVRFAQPVKAEGIVVAKMLILSLGSLGGP